MDVQYIGARTRTRHSTFVLLPKSWQSSLCPLTWKLEVGSRKLEVGKLTDERLDEKKERKKDLACFLFATSCGTGPGLIRYKCV